MQFYKKVQIIFFNFLKFWIIISFKPESKECSWSLDPSYAQKSKESDCKEPKQGATIWDPLREFQPLFTANPNYPENYFILDISFIVMKIFLKLIVNIVF